MGITSKIIVYRYNTYNTLCYNDVFDNWKLLDIELSSKENCIYIYIDWKLNNSSVRNIIMMLIPILLLIMSLRRISRGIIISL